MLTLSGKEALEKAVSIAGGQSALAREASKHAPEGRKLTQKIVWKWLNRAKGPVPSGAWAIPIEKAVGGQVSRHELRADLYPREQRAAEEQGAPAATLA